MIESLRTMWLDQYVEFLQIVCTIDDREMGAGFPAQRSELCRFCDACELARKPEAQPNDFERLCIRAHLEMLCNFAKRVVGSGAMGGFPLWSFVISQFHLFVIDAERNTVAGMPPLLEELGRLSVDMSGRYLQ